MTKVGRLLAITCLFIGFHAHADGLSDLVGEWVNVENYQHPSIQVTSTRFGYDVWISNWRRARITRSSCGGGNIWINDGRLSCCYYASFIMHGEGVVWQADAGNNRECPYLSGVYSRSNR